MKQIYDEDSANEASRESRKENYDYNSKMRTISTLLHDLHPKCNVEIRTKLALEGLTREQLEEVDNMVY